jgi:hypothetical protein
VIKGSFGEENDWGIADFGEAWDMSPAARKDTRDRMAENNIQMAREM